MGIGTKNKISSVILGITLILVLIASPTLVSFTQVSEILVYAQIVDTTAPTITVPPDFTTEATGVATPLDENDYGTATATDLVDPSPRIINNAPATFPLGDTTFSWFAIDDSDNISTATQTVTIVDTTAPTITVPPDFTTEATGMFTPLTENDYGTATASDIFEPVTVFSDAPATFPLGPTTITWIAIDDSGNTSIATQTVTIEDTIAPTITVPPDFTTEATDVTTPLGENDYGTATASDNIDPSPTITNNAPAAFPPGDTIIEWTATDASGNTSTATQTVTIVDTTIPSITAPLDQSFEATATLTPLDETDYGTATATDLVDPSPTITKAAPATFPLGPTTFTWIATDASDNISTATQTVTIVDTTAPTITVPPDFTTEATDVDTPLGENDYGTATASDIFGPVTISSDAPAEFPLGVTIIEWTATDDNGNTSTATQTVTIVDTTIPSITAPDNKSFQAIGVFTLLTENDYGTATASDIFEPVTVLNTAPAIFLSGATTIIWIAIDDNGNINTATQTVTIEDTTSPSITAPANKSFEATATLTPLSENNYGRATASDNADPSPTITNDAPATFPLGDTIIEWTATDASGNTSTATQTVTIVDTTAPTITVPPDFATTATGVDTPLDENDYGTATATDLVDPSLTITNNAPATFPLGDTTFSWFAIDASGNTSTATQTVTIAGETIPIVTAPANKLFEAAAIFTPLTESDYGTATATAVFGPVTVLNTAPAIFPLDDTIITWIAIDANGNIGTATQTVTIEDTTAPTITVPPDFTTEATDVTTPLGENDYGVI